MTRTISKSINAGKIEKIEVYYCSSDGPGIIEHIPSQPALNFHDWVMTGAGASRCGRYVYNKKDSAIADAKEVKEAFNKLDQYASSFSLYFPFWAPFPDDIVGDGIYLYEEGSGRVFAIYIPQLPSQHGGAVATWHYVDSKWTLIDMENSLRSSMYNDAKELFIPK